jgi:hypothetical protein
MRLLKTFFLYFEEFCPHLDPNLKKMLIRGQTFFTCTSEYAEIYADFKTTEKLQNSYIKTLSIKK